MVKKAAGLWIDHRKAVVVTVSEHGETTSLIVSRAEKHLGRVGGVQSLEPFESIRIPSDSRQEHRFHEHLATYYDAVIAALRDADAILIFGPGEAKVELKHRLTRDKSGERVVGIQTVDKMTNRQVAAKVVRHFA